MSTCHDHAFGLMISSLPRRGMKSFEGDTRPGHRLDRGRAHDGHREPPRWCVVIADQVEPPREVLTACKLNNCSNSSGARPGAHAWELHLARRSAALQPFLRTPGMPTCGAFVHIGCHRRRRVTTCSPNAHASQFAHSVNVVIRRELPLYRSSRPQLCRAECPHPRRTCCGECPS